MMQRYIGRLEYYGWEPKLWGFWPQDDVGRYDLKLTILRFFRELNGKRARYEHSDEHFLLAADEASEFRFSHNDGSSVLLHVADQKECANVCAFLDITLIRLSGRRVVLEIDDGRFAVFPDSSEDVHRLQFAHESEMCPVSEEVARTICRVGEENLCVFLMKEDGILQCCKFNSHSGRERLEELAEGARLGRIGNCAVFIY